MEMYEYQMLFWPKPHYIRSCILEGGKLLQYIMAIY